MYVIVVSNAYTDALHGPWRDEETAARIAERWNRAYERRGWKLRASARALLDKSAQTRDLVGAVLVESAEWSRRDEMRRLEADPCLCFAPDIDPDTVSDEAPDGVCACGHVPDEHEDDGTCDGMVVPGESGRS